LSVTEPAHEIVAGRPSASVVATSDLATSTAGAAGSVELYLPGLQQPGHRGVELVGALKNPLAIAAGITDGLGYGDKSEGGLDDSRACTRSGGSAWRSARRSGPLPACAGSATCWPPATVARAGIATWVRNWSGAEAGRHPGLEFAGRRRCADHAHRAPAANERGGRGADPPTAARTSCCRPALGRGGGWR